MDHYKFWLIDPPIGWQETLKLFGQCDAAPWTGIVYPGPFLGNPVVKTHLDDGTKTDIDNPDLHYLVYRLQPVPPQPPRTVVFSNQFHNGEEQTWSVGSPEWLLVPAGKTLKGTPLLQKGDHFACYPALDAGSFETNIQLEDQIDVYYKEKEIIISLVPRYFCVPVDKTRASGAFEPRLHPEDHLAIYDVIPPQVVTPLPVKTIDQFTRGASKAQRSVWLGVPSKKSKCEPVV